ncbi:conserved hypothetical protein [Lebetimonas natsushimae]|uniref:Flagellar hook-length control protein-like C-terminal domain-containing protein n=1 Tax=Lebetimonas natsushimae TaxID=1936991 RepID=A0A292YCA1_9BACT|nr:flagellar hook-length control protein FliK [Lebetimonas natsushimae]GAX87687.1 conserved hypothetical protein [Lebetimonas natsushimae]
MSSQLIELLTINIKTKNNSKIKPTQNFISELLKNIEPKKAIELLKNFNLTKEEIKEIISKLPEKDKKIYLELLNKEIIKNKLNLDNKAQNIEIKNINTKSTQTDTKTDLKNDIEYFLKLINKNDNLKLKDTPLNITEKKTKDIKNNDNINNIENILRLLLNNTQTFPQKIKKEIKKIKQDITQLIKKEIEANTKIENKLLTKKIITEIKNVNSFEELVSVANKHGLNIKKIITKIIKTEPQKPKYLPQIKIPNLKIVQNINKINSSILTLKHKANNNKNILQTLISSKNPHINNENITQNKNLNIDNLTNSDNKIDATKNNNENKTTDITINNFNPNTEIKHKIIKAKESIKYFSNNLKEAIKNYKPPISKLSIELHPKELGKVDITIIHRGDNLQININSNNQAINFFHSHQIELKNVLVNMGYNGIDMNFNSNQNRENQNKKAYKHYSSNKNDDNYDELIIEIPYTYA